MQLLGMLWGILSSIGMFVAFIPFLGWLNWANIPFALAGLVISIIAVGRARDNRGIGIAGIALCGIAVVVGAVRLTLGGGFF